MNADPHRPTWAEINLDHLVHNFRAVRSYVSDGVKICAVVKADAYGHGALPVAQTLERAGADGFAVALPEEGVMLREAGISRPILCLAGFWPGQEDILFDYRLTPVLSDIAAAERLEAKAHARGTTMVVHLKVDTGLGRLGLPLQELKDFLARFRRLTRVTLDGLMTHLASAGDPTKDDVTLDQIERFNQALRQIEAAGYRPRSRHLAASAGLYGYPQAWGTMVRPGGLLYGLWRDVLPPRSPLGRPLTLKPVLSLHTRIMLVKTFAAGTPLGYGGTFITRRKSRIATLPIGYADGYRRALSNCGRVLVRGRWAPVVGLVSMDLTLIDVTDLPEAAPGDEVILIGEQNGQTLTAEDLAGTIGTLSYEITSGIGGRVPRRLVGTGECSDCATDSRR